MGCGAGVMEPVVLRSFEGQYADVTVYETNIVVVAKRFLDKIETVRFDDTLNKKAKQVSATPVLIDNSRTGLYKGDNVSIDTGSLMNAITTFNKICNGVEMHVVLHAQGLLPERFVVGADVAVPGEFVVQHDDPQTMDAKIKESLLSPRAVAAKHKTHELTKEEFLAAKPKSMLKRRNSCPGLIKDAHEDEKAPVPVPLSPLPKARPRRASAPNALAAAAPAPNSVAELAKDARSGSKQSVLSNASGFSSCSSTNETHTWSHLPGAVALTSPKPEAKTLKARSAPTSPKTPASPKTPTSPASGGVPSPSRQRRKSI